MLDVVIDRNEWGYGRGHGMGSLWDIDNTKCCLGFACIAAGLTGKVIFQGGTPDELYNFLDEEQREKLAGLIDIQYVEDEDMYLHSDSDICEKLMSENDDEGIPKDKREENIIKLGKKAGINFSFVN